MAAKLGDYVVTEAGFGADLGAEKFLHIKARSAGIKPEAVVIVATVRALKMHGGVQKEDLSIENIEAIKNGLHNLAKHIETIQNFGLPYVVALNKFTGDTEKEMSTIMEWCQNHNHPIALTEVWEKGGEGGIDLAKKVIQQIEKKENRFSYLYEEDDSIEDKVLKIAKNVYGAKGVEYTSKAKKQLEEMKKNGWDKLLVCMAKTQYSLSDDPKKIGRPTNFTITIREFKPSVGAGFIVALTGEILSMPGLPKHPAALKMDVDPSGNAIGLF
jgi:formate--tetrahydrofolate ligase